MNLCKLTFLCFLLSSCIRQRPAQVWCFDDDQVTTLNGNVKQVIIGDSTTKAIFPGRAYFDEQDIFFKRFEFDEQGSLIYSERRTVGNEEVEHKKSSTTAITKTKYVLQIDTEGNKISMQGNYSGEYTLTSKWEFNKAGRVDIYIAGIDTPENSIVGRYKYNASGDLVEYKREFRGRKRDPETYKYRYDIDHQMIEADFYDDALLITTTFQYKKFDANKNWTIRVSHSQYHKPMLEKSITDTLIRKITYY